jgi:hypothetical protein
VPRNFETVYLSAAELAAAVLDPILGILIPETSLATGASEEDTKNGTVRLSD